MGYVIPQITAKGYYEVAKRYAECSLDALSKAAELHEYDPVSDYAFQKAVEDISQSIDRIKVLRNRS